MWNFLSMRKIMKYTEMGQNFSSKSLKKRYQSQKLFILVILWCSCLIIQQVTKRSKSSGGKQLNLWDSWWVDLEGLYHSQSISTHQPNNGLLISSKIQPILKKRQFWPTKSLRLIYFKSKCFNCQVAANCKIFIENNRYDSCKASSKENSLPSFFKNWQFDAYVKRN